MADEKCIALCDFTAQRPDELGFAKGDLITVIAKGKDSGFWEGAIGERRGLFPNCFVSSNMRPDRAPTFTNFAVALFAYTPQAPSELRFEKHDLIHVTGAGNSAGWYYGVNVSARRRDPAIDAVNDPPTPLLFPSNYVTCNLVKAMYVFKGRQRCELSLQPGDVIIVHRRWNDGWWEGSTVAHLSPSSSSGAAAGAAAVPTEDGSVAGAAGTGGFIVGGLRRGIFPSNYSTSNVCTLDPPLFCRRCRTVYPPKSTTCRECARNEEIVRTMTTTLEDVAAGRAAAAVDEHGSLKIDLFEHVDLDPSKGKGALLGPGDLKADGNTVRPRLAV